MKLQEVIRFVIKFPALAGKNFFPQYLGNKGSIATNLKTAKVWKSNASVDFVCRNLRFRVPGCGDPVVVRCKRLQTPLEEDCDV